MHGSKKESLGTKVGEKKGVFSGKKIGALSGLHLLARCHG